MNTDMDNKMLYHRLDIIFPTVLIINVCSPICLSVCLSAYLSIYLYGKPFSAGRTPGMIECKASIIGKERRVIVNNRKTKHRTIDHSA